MRFLVRLIIAVLILFLISLPVPMVGIHHYFSTSAMLFAIAVIMLTYTLQSVSGG